MNRIVTTLIIFFTAATTAKADTKIEVKFDNIVQKSNGSDISSEINIGSSQANGAEDVDIKVNGKQVVSLTEGRVRQSKINIGTVNSDRPQSTETKIHIDGTVLLENQQGRGEINIGNVTDK